MCGCEGKGEGWCVCLRESERVRDRGKVGGGGRERRGGGEGREEGRERAHTCYKTML